MRASSDEQMEEPLLGQPAGGETPTSRARGQPAAAAGDGGGPPLPLTHSPDGASKSSLAVSVVILSKTILGAGMAALPRAFVMLGALAAGGTLLLMSQMTHWSVEALTLGTVVTGHMSYPAVVQALCGRGGSLLLQLSLVFRCAGLMIVYIIIAADVLAGHPGAPGHAAGTPGLLCDLFGGGAAAGWCASRRGAAAVVAVFFMAPLVTPPRLSSTAVTSWVGLVAVAILAGVTVALAGAAAAQGVAYPLRLLPDLQAFSGGPAQVAMQLVAVIPILATAFTCQMTVHHIMREVRPFTERRMAATSASAVAVCTALFLAVALGAQLAFGPDVPADVLTQFNAERLSPLVGLPLARLFYVLVRLGFLLSITTIFPMQFAPYRESLSRLLVGRELTGPPFYVLTYASLALFYWVAMHAGSIWVPLQFVGATAGALIAFWFPSWIALAALARRDPAALASPRYWRWNAWALAAIGTAQAIAGVANVIFFPPKEPGNGSGSAAAALLYFL